MRFSTHEKDIGNARKSECISKIKDAIEKPPDYENVFKSEEAGAGGVILDPVGQIVKTFAWDLGHKTNNEAEWMTLLQGLEMIDQGSISNLLVLGDSRHVILKMRSGYFVRSINCRKYYNRISHLVLPTRTSFFHILRSNNAFVDSLANKGASLPQCAMLLNDQGVALKFIP